MSAKTSHWKLGLFVVVSLLLGLASVVYVGARTFKKDTVQYHSYFDESVSGLQMGSPVSFRGVTIGNISEIDVAPDRRHVEVSYALGMPELVRLGLMSKDGRPEEPGIPRGLRVQLSTMGITGSKYLKVDFFDPDRNPPPVLPFPPGRNYIPATPSTLKNLEEALVEAVDALPDLTYQLGEILALVQRILRSTDEHALPDKAVAALARLDRTLAVVEREVSGLRLAELSGETRLLLENLNGNLSRTHAILEKVDGDTGLLSSMQRATDSIGDIARDAQGAGVELDGTLRDLRDAARSVRALMSDLERQPDMLVKGRSEVAP